MAADDDFDAAFRVMMPAMPIPPRPLAAPDDEWPLSSRAVGALQASTHAPPPPPPRSTEVHSLAHTSAPAGHANGDAPAAVGARTAAWDAGGDGGDDDEEEEDEVDESELTDRELARRRIESLVLGLLTRIGRGLDPCTLVGGRATTLVGVVRGAPTAAAGAASARGAAAAKKRGGGRAGGRAGGRRGKATTTTTNTSADDSGDDIAALFVTRPADRLVYTGARDLASMLRVLRSSYELLLGSRTATQRELYYLHAQYFASQDEANGALGKVTQLLGLPRHALGVLAACRGWYAGPVRVTLDASAGGGGDAPAVVITAADAANPRPVPPEAVCEDLTITVPPEGAGAGDDRDDDNEEDEEEEADTGTGGGWSDGGGDDDAEARPPPRKHRRLEPAAATATTAGRPSTTASASASAAPPVPVVPVPVPVRRPAFILVIEKDCIFRRLVEDRIWETLPCILVTGCGFPDVATRAFVWQLHTQLGGLPVLGLSDCNPFGAAIMLCYRDGSATNPEANAFTVPLQWVGLRTGDIARYRLPPAARQPLTGVDERKCASLLRYLEEIGDHHYANEVEGMLASGAKMELEGILARGLGFLARSYLPRKVLVEADYI